jgi:hypothetical protein
MANSTSCRPALAGAFLIWVAGAAPLLANLAIERTYRIAGGKAIINFDAEGSEVFAVHPSSSERILTVNGMLSHVPAGLVSLVTNGGDLRLVFNEPAADDAPIIVVDAAQNQTLYHLAGADLFVDPAGESFTVSAALIDSKSVGGVPSIVGHFRLEAVMALESEYVYVIPEREPLAEPSMSGDQRGFPNPGPDLITGDITHLHEYGRDGDQISVAAGTIACNKGDTRVRWNAFPSVDHPVMTLNFYRLKDDRFEQLGYSWVKHGFGASQQNGCLLGCTAGCPFQALCTGCSDPYTSNQIADQSSVTGRNWINPFTGAFTANINNHAGHTHSALSHRVTLDEADIAQDQGNNSTARYFSEGLYIAPHEFLPNNGLANNQNNNYSHRELTVVGDTGDWFGFYPQTELAVRESPALDEWPGATRVIVEPDPGQDGRAILAYKVTALPGGGWHYEYALFNQNLDRAIGLFRMPFGDGAQVTNISFHAPRHEPGSPNDGTTGGSGLSNGAWTVSAGSGAVEWSTESLAGNPNANAIRWGTLYNFSFDSDQAPTAVSATLGFFKTGTSATATAQGPSSLCLGDVDGDRRVDLNDLTVTLSLFGLPCSSGPCLGADIDHDGDIDLTDLTAILSAFGTTCP